jgi:uncharacterized Zn finger protein (UPF0148 family)
LRLVPRAAGAGHDTSGISRVLLTSSNAKVNYFRILGVAWDQRWNMATIGVSERPMSYSVYKRFLGEWHVEYRCPRCRTPLETALIEAGQTFPCPTCRSIHPVPGEDDLKRIQQQQAAESEARHRRLIADARAKHGQRRAGLNHQNAHSGETQQMQSIVRPVSLALQEPSAGKPPPLPPPLFANTHFVPSPPLPPPPPAPPSSATNQQSFGDALGNVIKGLIVVH